MRAVLEHWTLEPCTCSGSKPCKLALAANSPHRCDHTDCCSLSRLGTKQSLRALCK